MQVEDLSLKVSFLIGDPLGKRIDHELLKSLNDPAVSDCAFSVKGTTTLLYASRAILAAKSTFFRTMFKGTWAEAARSATLEPIQFDSWDSAAVKLVLVHVYSGWLPGPGEPLPKFMRKLVRDLVCDPNEDEDEEEADEDEDEDEEVDENEEICSEKVQTVG
ncbi:hypothetical protein GGF32_000331 [Allomyces javanicus]|nr:hypothetical protein GGF32_000331 [Allomyces javanicus]